MADKDNTYPPTLEQLDTLIETGNADNLLGLEECAHFEVRGHTYDTKNIDSVKRDKAIQSLLFDVTSIANSGGGYIFIGVDTEKKPNQRVEFISKISGVKDEFIFLDSWSSIIPDYTIPRLSFVSFKHGFIESNDKKIFWLLVPNAVELGLYPVIVRKAKWEVKDSDLLKGNMFGLFHRDGSENLLESPEKIQQILSKGLAEHVDTQQVNAAQFQELLSQIEQINKTVSTPTRYKIVGPKKEKAFLENASDKLDSKTGFFYIYAEPVPTIEVPNFRDSEYMADNIYTHIKNPPTLRRMGWGLEVSGSDFPYPNGNSWEITNGQRKLLQVTKSGEVFGAVSIDDTLSWGTDKYRTEETDADVLVTELALIEYIYNFCSFLRSMKERVNDLKEFKLTAGFDVPEGVKVGLLRSERISVLMYTPEGTLGNHRQWKQDYPLEVEPEEVAGELSLEIVMGGFGVTGQPLTITKNDDGKTIVNTQFYKSI